MDPDDNPKTQENKSPDDFDETEALSASGEPGTEAGSRETQPPPNRDINPAVDDFGDYGSEGGGGQTTTQHTGPAEGEEDEKGEGLV